MKLKTFVSLLLLLLLIKICIQYCGCSPSQFCGIKEPGAVPVQNEWEGQNEKN